MADPAAPGGRRPGQAAESERRRRGSWRPPARCFGRLGFAGATVETIAGEAGVSNGLLYQFFRNKEHLFGVVIDELVRDWARAMAAGEREPSAARALEAMFRGSFEFARGNPLLADAPHRGRRAPARALPAPERRPRAGAPRRSSRASCAAASSRASSTPGLDVAARRGPDLPAPGRLLDARLPPRPAPPGRRRARRRRDRASSSTPCAGGRPASAGSVEQRPPEHGDRAPRSATRSPSTRTPTTPPRFDAW